MRVDATQTRVRRWRPNFIDPYLSPTMVDLERATRRALRAGDVRRVEAYGLARAVKLRRAQREART